MPEPSAADALAFRPLRAADLPTLHRWLNDPAVFRWYGGAGPTPEAVEEKYGPRIAGDSPVRPFLILHTGSPIGYVQVYAVASFPTHAAHTGDDAGAVAVDMLLGEDAARGRGLGSAALRRFLGSVAFADPAVARCFIDRHPDNAAAIRAYRRAGFRPLRRVAPPLGGEPCLLMAIAREELTRMLDEAAVRIVTWSPPEITAARDAIREIFAAAFGMADDEAAAYAANLDRHGGYPGFRFLAALDPDDARPLGFVYGYSSRPGQWFHDTIRPALGPEGAARWLDDAFEYVEFAVRPEAQGRGIGGRLHDAILADLPHRTAILATYDDEAGALPFYRRRDWQTLVAGYHFPDIARPYVLMGRELGSGNEGTWRQA